MEWRQGDPALPTCRAHGGLYAERRRTDRGPRPRTRGGRARAPWGSGDEMPTPDQGDTLWHLRNKKGDPQASLLGPHIRGYQESAPVGAVSSSLTLFLVVPLQIRAGGSAGGGNGT